MSSTLFSYTSCFISFGKKGSLFSSIVEYRKDLVSRLLMPKENIVVSIILLERSKFYRLSRMTRVSDKNLVVVVAKAAAPAIVR